MRLLLAAVASTLLVAGFWAVIALDGSFRGDTGNAAEVRSSTSTGSRAIKSIADRTRPPGAGLTTPSFPSGHTTWTTAVFGLAAVFLLQRGHRLWATCVVVIAAIGPARVMLGVHWTSDVLTGYAVGLAWLIVLVLFSLPWAAADGHPTDSADARLAPPSPE